MERIDYVIYHHPCFDGSGGAWCVTEYCRRQGLSMPELIGVKPGCEEYKFPSFTGKFVVVVDISFQRSLMKHIIDESERIIVLDHHRSAQRQLEGLEHCIFDMTRSGAEMAWDYFFPNEDKPRFIQHIGDRDLWRWDRDENSKAFSAALFNKFQFATPEETLAALDQIANFNQEKYEEFVRYGEQCLEIEEKNIQLACKKAVKCELKCADDSVYTVWTSDSRLHRSEIGNTLAKRPECDFALIYSYDLKSNEWWISMRGIEEKGFDLSEIAARFPRGGGHPLASGFTWSGHIRDILRVLET